MLNYGNRRQVERKLKEKCRLDRARIQIGRISNFGLLEMSRQRLRESHVRWNIKLTDESFVLKLLKILELKSLENKAKIIKVEVNKKVSQFIENYFLKNIEYFEKKNKLKINIESDEHLSPAEYKIHFLSKTKKTIEKLEKIIELKKIDPSSTENKKIINIKPGKHKFKKKKYFKKKFYKKKLN